MEHRPGAGTMEERGAHLLPDIEGDVLKLGFVHENADDTVRESVNISFRAAQLEVAIVAEADSEDEAYTAHIQQLLRDQSEAKSRNELYIRDAKQLHADTQAYMELKLDLDRRMAATRHARDQVIAEVERLQSDHTLFNEQSLGEMVFREEILSPEIQKLDQAIAGLREEARLLEEQFLQTADMEHLSEYHNYSGSSYRHGLNNLSSEKQEQLRVLEEYRAQCLGEKGASAENGHELQRLEVQTEYEINRLRQEVAQYEAELQKFAPEAEQLHREYQRLVGLEMTLRERFQVRFEVASPTAPQPSETQEAPAHDDTDLRVSVDDLRSAPAAEPEPVEEEPQGWRPRGREDFPQAEQRKTRRGLFRR